MAHWMVVEVQASQVGICHICSGMKDVRQDHSLYYSTYGIIESLSLIKCTVYSRLSRLCP